MRTAQYRDERIRLCPSVCPLPYLEDHSKLHTKFSVFFIRVNRGRFVSDIAVFVLKMDVKLQLTT